MSQRAVAGSPRGLSRVPGLESEQIALALLYPAVALQYLSLHLRAAVPPDQSLQVGILLTFLLLLTVLAHVVSRPARAMVLTVIAGVFGVLLATIVRAIPLMSVGVGMIVLLTSLLTRRVEAVGLSALLLLCGGIALTYYDTPWPAAIELRWTEVSIGMLGVSGAGALIIRRLLLLRSLLEDNRARIANLSNAVEELSKANLGYSTFVRYAEDQAMIEERNRITREIHDGVGYTLSNTIMLSQLAMQQLKGGGGQLPNTLHAILVQAKAGLADTRHSLHLLRSSDTSDNRGVQGLRRMIRIFQQATGVNTSFRLFLSPRIVEHPEIFLTIYRLIQESLTNAFRHGHASHVEVTIHRNENWIVVVIRDNGMGAASINEGIGLAGMRERVEHLGGTITISRPEETRTGFRVSAHIPVQQLEDS